MKPFFYTKPTVVTKTNDFFGLPPFNSVAKHVNFLYCLALQQFVYL